jgi:hypothetical protein
MGHVLLDKRHQRREAGPWIVRAGKLNYNAQRTSPKSPGGSFTDNVGGSAAKVKAPAQGNEDRQAMKELLRSNDAVLLSYVSALLEEGDIAFMVADSNMSVMEGSIGVLPRRVLVETDKIVQARNILTEAGIGHVIADDKKA